ATVAVVTLTSYFHGAADPRPAARDHGKVAQYAWAADYHGVVGRRLERLASAVRELVPDSRTRCYVDAGPVPERELAQRAGLGWIGKNTMLVHPKLGSFTFIGVILTDAALAPDAPFEADRCGTCTRCLEACPTAAFPDSRVLDSRRCISYLTIEHRGGLTPFARPGSRGMRRHAGRGSSSRRWATHPGPCSRPSSSATSGTAWWRDSP